MVVLRDAYCVAECSWKTFYVIAFHLNQNRFSENFVSVFSLKFNLCELNLVLAFSEMPVFLYEYLDWDAAFLFD